MTHALLKNLAYAQAHQHMHCSDSREVGEQGVFKVEVRVLHEKDVCIQVEHIEAHAYRPGRHVVPQQLHEVQAAIYNAHRGPGDAAEGTAKLGEQVYGGPEQAGRQAGGSTSRVWPAPGQRRQVGPRIAPGCIDRLKHHHECMSNALNEW